MKKPNSTIFRISLSNLILILLSFAVTILFVIVIRQRVELEQQESENKQIKGLINKLERDLERDIGELEYKIDNFEGDIFELESRIDDLQYLNDEY